MGDGVPRSNSLFVHPRSFAGLDILETAEALGVLAPRVKLSGSFARTWHCEALEEDPTDDR